VRALCVPATGDCFKSNGGSTRPQVEETVPVYIAMESQSHTPKEQVDISGSTSHSMRTDLTADFLDFETICRGLVAA